MNKTVKIYVPLNFSNPQIPLDGETQIALTVAALNVLKNPEIKSSASRDTACLVLKAFVLNWQEVIDALDGATNVTVYTRKKGDENGSHGEAGTFC